MIPGMGGVELAISAILALVVVGPKDLPVLLRRLGKFTAKLRGMAAEFRSSFDEMARQSELDELPREVEARRASQLGLGEAHAPISQTFDEINRGVAADPYPYTPPPIVPAE